MPRRTTRCLEQRVEGRTQCTSTGGPVVACSVWVLGLGASFGTQKGSLTKLSPESNAAALGTSLRMQSVLWLPPPIISKRPCPENITVRPIRAGSHRSWAWAGTASPKKHYSRWVICCRAQHCSVRLSPSLSCSISPSACPLSRQFGSHHTKACQPQALAGAPPSKL